MAAPNPAPPTPEASEPEPGSPAALALLAQLGISPRAAAGAPLAPDDEGFSPIAIGHLNHSLVEVKLLLDQLGAVHKELHETLGLAHLRGDPLHLLPPPAARAATNSPAGCCSTATPVASNGSTGPHRPAQELEARIKAQQLYKQLTGNAQSSLGAAFWELRFPKR